MGLDLIWIYQLLLNSQKSILCSIAASLAHGTSIKRKTVRGVTKFSHKFLQVVQKLYRLFDTMFKIGKSQEYF